jgi:4-amino-4-deoxy-L-arabinose transferase-like glycosyltransferase
MDYGPATQESADLSARAASSPQEAVAPSRRLGHRSRSRSRAAVSGSWLLAVILAVQALLSIRLVRADTAFQDEALYLWAGHLEWAHVLHGGQLPQFPAYFSGAPVIYPPLGALADSVGGLVAARLLSLVFMLGTTSVLWFTAGRLFGRRAAFFSAALFAVLGPTLHLGAFATYDAMSLFLLALATWFAVRAGDRQDATVWMVAAGVTLALANATSYPSTLFDPVVVLIALAVAFPNPGGRLAAGRALTLATITALLITIGLLIGGSLYIHGVDATTLTRVAGTDSPLIVLAHSFSWTGIIVVAAVCGAIIGWVTKPRHPQTWLLTILAAAALLVPIEQALLSTTASLNKHGDLGAWFAAIAAGYAVSKVIEAVPEGSTRTVTVAACVVALSFPVTIGISQSRNFSTDWPNSSAFVAILRALADNGNGHLLVEDPSIAEYYLPSGSQWQRWSSTRNIVLPSGAPTGGPSVKAGIVGDGNAGTFGLYIQQGYFSIVALNFMDTTSLDQAIAADLRKNHHYHRIEIVPYGLGTGGAASGKYLIWQYEPHS